MMEKVFIDSQEKWKMAIKLENKQGEVPEGLLWIDYNLSSQFMVYAIKRASISGFICGVVSSLVFVVVLGVIVRLMLR